MCSQHNRYKQYESSPDTVKDVRNVKDRRIVGDLRMYGIDGELHILRNSNINKKGNAIVKSSSEDKTQYLSIDEIGKVRELISRGHNPSTTITQHCKNNYTQNIYMINNRIQQNQTNNNFITIQKGYYEKSDLTDAYLNAVKSLPYEQISSIDNIEKMIDRIEEWTGGQIDKCLHRDGEIIKSQAIAFYQDVYRIIRDKVQSAGNMQLCKYLNDEISALSKDEDDNNLICKQQGVTVQELPDN